MVPKSRVQIWCLSPGSEYGVLRDVGGAVLEAHCERCCPGSHRTGAYARSRTGKTGGPAWVRVRSPPPTARAWSLVFGTWPGPTGGPRPLQDPEVAPMRRLETGPPVPRAVLLRARCKSSRYPSLAAQAQVHSTHGTSAAMLSGLVVGAGLPSKKAAPGLDRGRRPAPSTMTGPGAPEAAALRGRIATFRGNPPGRLLKGRGLWPTQPFGSVTILQLV